MVALSGVLVAGCGDTSSSRSSPSSAPPITATPDGDDQGSTDTDAASAPDAATLSIRV
jgi:hypothetical protein